MSDKVSPRLLRRRSLGPALVFFAAVSMSLGRASVAAGQTASEAARAEKLFAEANALIDQQNYADACPKLEESQRLDPALGTQFNLALCYEKIGRLSSAWRNLQAVERLAHATGKKGREDAAREKLAELRPRVGHLVLTGAEGDATVKVDGEPADREMWSFYPVEPGEHTIDVTEPGKKPWQLRMTVPEPTPVGAEVAVAVPPLPAADRETKTTTLGTDAPNTTMRTLGFAAGGLGAAGLVTAIITGVLILGNKSTADEKCTPKCLDQDGRDAVAAGKSLVPLNVISWAVAVAGLGVGAYLVWTTNPKPGVAGFSPTVRLGAGSASFGGTF